eukprot:CAMPEP_0116079412 /NCGR_PEP_ID=MMETSP0327-20121206/1126_1 /TAXON_ID=44447 /ORGANISM="Pseudo-nitzschia delicatissima, Strain B596" /LENGTH=39 /DNA_ID= /DNA_START= /DNA_END= /DNA_ORIENTATION=
MASNDSGKKNGDSKSVSWRTNWHAIGIMLSGEAVDIFHD